MISRSASKRFLLAGGALVLTMVLLCFPMASRAVGAPVSAKFLIVPGKSIGPLKIGMTRKQAKQGMMSTFKVRARLDPVTEGLCWFSGNLCATFLAGKDSLVTAAVKGDRRFMIQERVRIGSDTNDAVERLGQRLGRPGVINTSDGAFVSWLGLQMTVTSLGSGKFVVSSLMVTPKR